MRATYLGGRAVRFRMRWQTAMSVFLAVAVSVGVFIAVAFADTADFAGEPALEINRFSIDAGGTVAAVGGGFELSGTIGQPDAGVLSGGDFTLAGGFWFEEPPSDCNSTGNVDLFDYGDLEACLADPGDGLVAPFCACFDFDTDQDVDLEDVGAFQRFFSGS